MNKQFTHNGSDFTISKRGYGQYLLEMEDSVVGYASCHCTDSEVWDYCEDDSDKGEEVRKVAEATIMRAV